MYIFDENCRVTKTDKGIVFNEQDILNCKYSFSGDMTIDMNISYTMPGFGILLTLDESNDMAMSEDAYLYKVGASDFIIVKRHLNETKTLETYSSVIKATRKNINQHFKMDIVGKQITFTAYVKNESGKEEAFVLGTHKLKESLGKYHVSFYSNRGNVIQSVKFKQPLPKHWNTSIDNTDGGHVSFIEDGFIIENCVHDAELEQNDVCLEAGTYFLSYKHEPVNNQYDVEAFVFPNVKPNANNESELEDENKSILQKNGSFTLTEPTNLILKFRGTNGKISEIYIHTNANGNYVATEDKTLNSGGSCLEINLEDVIKVEWSAIIKHAPEYTELTKKAPYGIVSTEERNYTMEDFNLTLDKEYRYAYDVKTAELSAAGETIVIERTDADGAVLKIMYNLNATIYDLKIIYSNNEEEQVITKRNFSKYVPLQISSPIIVQKKANEEVLDLSAAYREETEMIREFKFTATRFLEKEIDIVNGLPDNAINLKVYGVPKGVAINNSGKTIDEYVTTYTELSNADYSLKKGVVTISEKAKMTYDYIVTEYNKINGTYYYFTNYEREVFESTKNRELELSKAISWNNMNVTIYGIRKNTFFNENNLYKIPSRKNPNFIDYYANDYDVIDNDLYTVDVKNNIIKLTENMDTIYDHYVVDYMKKDSYAINISEELAQYEIDISVDDEEVEMIYDMHQDGTSSEYLNIIAADPEEKFIVLREVAQEDED